ncbi:MAG: ParE family toxin-like protein [Limisphaerales bacterium]
MTSRGTGDFWELYQRLPHEIQAAARIAYRKFRDNPAHPSLRLERLRSDPRAWSVRISLNYRAVALRRGDAWIWVWIGEHQAFDRRFPA